MENHGPALTLARLTVAPALIIIAWLVVALPVLLTGNFTIGPALALFVPAVAVLLYLGFRGTRRDVYWVARPASWWTVAGVAVVAIAFLVLQLATASQQIIVRRDAARSASKMAQPSFSIAIKVLHIKFLRCPWVPEQVPAVCAGEVESPVPPELCPWFPE